VKIVGIICEYNPFHFGHLRQFRMIRERFGTDTAIVCVMSGNYVQRGEPAMWDKFTRARTAVACGADLVLELPVTGVLQSAEGFAQCGVEILTRFGADTLCFGTECGSTEYLMSLAERMTTEEFKDKLQGFLSEGLSYAAARQLAAEDQEDVLSKPNNILGLEYCKAILEQRSSLQPYAILRNGDYHAETADAKAPSASAIRKLVPDGNWKDYLPVAELMAQSPWYAMEFGERAVLARLRGMTNEEWERAAHGSEGLWSKAMKAARRESSLQAVMDAVKSKRYPMSRIRRLLLCAYLGLSAEDLHKRSPYVRILAADSLGFSLVKQAKRNRDIDLINPGEIPENRDYYAKEITATDLFSLFAAPGFETLCCMEQTARIVAGKIFQ